MAKGPGKYDDLCTTVRETADAQAVVLIVINGKKGTGFSVQSVNHDIGAKLPDLLRLTASVMEET